MENILNPDPQQCPSGHYGATVVLVVDLVQPVKIKVTKKLKQSETSYNEQGFECG